MENDLEQFEEQALTKNDTPQTINNESEQPIKTDNTQAVITENLNNEEVLEQFLEGSPVGKFKDAKSLLEAYNNLQAEFTRKSQKLSQALKELSVRPENAQDAAPDYTSEILQERVNEFLQNNPQAKQYAGEISELILNDKVFSKNKNSLELAWAKILASKYKSGEELSRDKDFLNTYIINNKEVQEQIIKNYLTSLQQNRGATVISSHSGSAFSLAPKNKPKNLAEARELAAAFFKI